MNSKNKNIENTILWVDDDVYFMQKIVGYLSDNGYRILMAENPDEALNIIHSEKKINLVIVDIMMPHGKSLSPIESMGGYATGLALSRKILQINPEINIMAFSVSTEKEIMDWFYKNTLGYLLKPAKTNDLLRMIQKGIGNHGTKNNISPNSFIIHGHDEISLLQLKNYIQNTLKFNEPIVLREQPSMGKTIIEKFETISQSIDIVFVLLTPDDKALKTKSDDEYLRRARQNVIFEMGYFFGKLQRLSGKVILLYKGKLDIPSDISGIIFIDISKGIESAGELIRRELKEWL